MRTKGFRDVRFSEHPMNQQRRSLLAGLKAGVAGLAIGGAVKGQSKSASARWEPARHDKDDWLETPGAKHRLIFDTTTPEGFGEALLFAGNYINVNKSDYGLPNTDLAIVIVARHRSTPFGYTDAMWAKYSVPIARRSLIAEPPKVNPNSAQIADLAKQGVRVAVCSVATRRFAEWIAEAVGGNVDAVNTELVGNRVGSSLMVPAGIVAVNRAQERGYSLVKA
jgi:intracellular sulfur oxidation DsrE/DsrF family protein